MYRKNHILFKLLMLLLHQIILHVSGKDILERIQNLIMTIDDEIRDEKLQYDVKEKQQKYQLYHQVKLMNVNILQVKKY